MIAVNNSMNVLPELEQKCESAIVTVESILAMGKATSDDMADLIKAVPQESVMYFADACISHKRGKLTAAQLITVFARCVLPSTDWNPALPSPLRLENRGYMNFTEGYVNEGNTTYCRICERVLTTRPREGDNVLRHMDSHFDEYYRGTSLSYYAEYLIVVNNAFANRCVHAVERRMVAAVKPKGQKMKCDICNKDITKTPDKARHIANHFGDKQLPADWEKYIVVGEAHQLNCIPKDS